MDTNEAIKTAFDSIHEESANDIKDLPDYVLKADKFTLLKLVKELAIEVTSSKQT